MDGPLTKKELDESTAKWRAYRHEIGAPVDAPAAAKSVNEHDARLIQGIMKGLASVLFEYEQQIEALTSRVTELERSQKTYLGVWKADREYSSHSEVTHDGARWFCHKRTSDKPGSSADWSLMEKSAPAVLQRSDTASARPRQNGGSRKFEDAMIDTLAETIRLANKYFEREIESAELLLIDLGPTGEEIEVAIGRDGFMRKMLEADRDQQIREVNEWIASLKSPRADFR